MCICYVVEHKAQKADLKFHNCFKKLDEGNYTCRSVDNHSMKDTIMIQGNDTFLFN